MTITRAVNTKTPKISKRKKKPKVVYIQQQYHPLQPPTPSSASCAGALPSLLVPKHTYRQDGLTPSLGSDSRRSVVRSSSFAVDSSFSSLLALDAMQQFKSHVPTKQETKTKRDARILRGKKKKEDKASARPLSSTDPAVGKTRRL